MADCDRLLAHADYLDRCGRQSLAATLRRAALGPGLDEEAIRRDERQRLAELLEEHLNVFAGFAKDDVATVQLIAFFLRLNGQPEPEPFVSSGVANG